MTEPRTAAEAARDLNDTDPAGDLDDMFDDRYAQGVACSYNVN